MAGSAHPVLSQILGVPSWTFIARDFCHSLERANELQREEPDAAEESRERPHDHPPRRPGAVGEYQPEHEAAEHEAHERRAGGEQHAAVHATAAGGPNSPGAGPSRSTCKSQPTIRSAARPSPYGFDAWAMRAYSERSASSRRVSSTMSAYSAPTSRNVPASSPSGRSVSRRMTSTGLPSVGASS